MSQNLALGDLGLIVQKPDVPTFELYPNGWLKTHAEVECRRSTKRSYERLLRLHVTPRFGKKKLAAIAPESIKQFLVE